MCTRILQRPISSYRVMAAMLASALEAEFIDQAKFPSHEPKSWTQVWFSSNSTSMVSVLSQNALLILRVYARHTHTHTIDIYEIRAQFQAPSWALLRFTCQLHTLRNHEAETESKNRWISVTHKYGKWASISIGRRAFWRNNDLQFPNHFRASIMRNPNPIASQRMGHHPPKHNFRKMNIVLHRSHIILASSVQYLHNGSLRL